MGGAVQPALLLRGTAEPEVRGAPSRGPVSGVAGCIEGHPGKDTEGWGWVGGTERTPWGPGSWDLPGNCSLLLPWLGPPREETPGVDGGEAQHAGGQPAAGHAADRGDLGQLPGAEPSPAGVAGEGDEGCGRVGCLAARCRRVAHPGGTRCLTGCRTARARSWRRWPRRTVKSGCFVARAHGAAAGADRARRHPPGSPATVLEYHPPPPPLHLVPVAGAAHPRPLAHLGRITQIWLGLEYLPVSRVVSGCPLVCVCVCVCWDVGETVRLCSSGPREIDLTGSWLPCGGPKLCTWGDTSGVC
ncbi:transmembrane protein 191C isoform X2 [Suncus etruscus]|uniref:transmembrane protein 191C isoform X2 n=1 Tax=Suncus etruscus TaxID=109475 RepID=UPI002110498C|nr:transmembrane protein 191C isoform X2 [Suncus etruscus]